MVAAKSRPWYRLHWLTWLVIGVVIWALIDCQLEEKFPLWSHFGWPLAHLELEEKRVSRGADPAPQFRYEYEWRGWRLVGNCLFCTLFVGSTAFVCEAWVRSQRRWQFTFRHFLVVTAVLSVLMALCEWDFRGTWWSVVDWWHIFQPIRWPVLFALACTIYTVGWLAARLNGRVCRLVARRRQ